MSSDDYFRITYSILMYLYSQLRAGNTYASIRQVTERADIPCIPENYLLAIMNEMIRKNLIRVSYSRQRDVNENSSVIEHTEIAMDGVEYLKENSNMKRIAEFIGDVKAILFM